MDSWHCYCSSSEEAAAALSKAEGKLRSFYWDPAGRLFFKLRTEGDGAQEHNPAFRDIE